MEGGKYQDPPYDDLTNRPETENGAPPASGGVNSPNSWGSQASNNSYTEDIWTANGTWLVKDAQGNMTRVGSEAEAIAATGGNTDPTTPPVSGEGASGGRCFVLMTSYRERTGLATGLGRMLKKRLRRNKKPLTMLTSAA